MSRLRDEISLYMSHNYNSTMCVVVSGNGVRYPNQGGSGYIVSALALYPLPDLVLPTAAQKNKAGKNVTLMYPSFEPDVEIANVHGMLNSSASLPRESHAKTQKDETTTPRAARRKVGTK